MKYISLFAGIGGFDLALQRLGHTCVYANEWDKYAAQTYEKNFGHKPDTRSIVDVPAGEIPDHELLVGGFPCQSFSVAGLRGGFTDTRGTLFFDIARILSEKQPRLFLLENVKGLLSHDNGRTIKTIIVTLTNLGYDLQWQVLNSKNFGVPQNRERIFIIGNLRGKSRPQVFPFRENDSVHTKGFISTTLRAHEGGPNQNDTFIEEAITPTLRATEHKHGDNQTLVVQRVPLKFLTRNQRKIEGDYAYTVDGHSTGGILINHGKVKEKNDTANALDANYWKGLDNHGQRTGVMIQNIPHGFNKAKPKELPNLRASLGAIHNEILLPAIRRLTPIECERLQGFPDGWTAGVSDTQRYKQLGNAVTVNVVEAIVRAIG